MPVTSRDTLSAGGKRKHKGQQIRTFKVTGKDITGSKTVIKVRATSQSQARKAAREYLRKHGHHPGKLR